MHDETFFPNMNVFLQTAIFLASMTNQTFIKGKAAYGGQAQSTQIAKLLEDALDTDLRADGFPARLV